MEELEFEFEVVVAWIAVLFVVQVDVNELLDKISYFK